MEPDDPTLDPVDIVTEPEVPDDAVPVDISIEPLIPAVPLFDVLIVMSPLVVAEEYPLVIDIFPPVFVELPPPTIAYSAPVELEVPTSNEILPDVPEFEDPVEKIKSPDSFKESPVLITTSPEYPNEYALVIFIDPLPNDEDLLIPETKTISPPDLVREVPADIDTSEPTVLELDPTASSIVPALPEEESPVEIKKLPVSPRDESPEYSDIFPDDAPDTYEEAENNFIDPVSENTPVPL